MISIDKILFPTDFSECAETALAWSVLLAGKFEAEMLMFHAVVLHGDDVGEEVYSRFPDLNNVMQAILENAGTRLQKEIPTEGSVVMRRLARRGVSATEEIIGVSRDEGVDLIVMGTHGRRGLRHLILGSVAERVIRDAPCSVMTIRCSDGGHEQTIGVDRILLPIDFSDPSRRAARYAVALSRVLGAKLEVVHVIDRAIHPSFYAIGRESLLQIDPNLRERVERAIAEFMETAGSGVEYDSAVVEGKPAVEIAGLASEMRDTVVVIASRGAGGLERMMLGSTTERVVRLASCPVLIVKRGGRDLDE